MTCTVQENQLWLSDGTVRRSLGVIAAMPLTVGGAAGYNIANLAAAALAANAIGIPHHVVARVLATFGRSRADNPGRLERWELGDVTVLIDYAHNPDGLARLLEVSRSLLRGTGKLRLLLGQAGNRDDAAIVELAVTAAGAQPELIVIKELPSMLRGRAPGEVPGLLQAGLVRAGYAVHRIRIEADEIEAAWQLLQAAAAGDVIVLPVHQSTSRQRLTAWLDVLEQVRWMSGSSLPPVAS
jgi:UDP-N-acetylmuramyl tripeptide synthase